MKFFRFKLYCETDGWREFDALTITSPPSACDIDAGHTVRAGSLSVTEIEGNIPVPDGSLDLAAYKTHYQRKVDDDIGAAFWAGLTVSGVSLEAQTYILLAHLSKGMEAQDIIDDRDGKDDEPRSYERDAQNNKKRKVIEKEAAKRGLTKEQLSDAVHPWSSFQVDFIAAMEEIRPTTKDAITAAVDVAGVDAAYAQFQTDLGTALAGLTPPA